MESSLPFTPVIPISPIDEDLIVTVHGGSIIPTHMNLRTPINLNYFEAQAYEAKVLDKAYVAGLLAMVSYREFSPIRGELSDSYATWERIAAQNKSFASPDDESLGHSREKVFHLIQSMEVKPVSNLELGLCENNRDGLEYSMEGLARPDITYNMNSDGFYQAQNGLAAAWVTKQPDLDNPGKFKLNVSFRGTEFSDLSSYLLHAYPNMSWHYAQFRPLSRALVDFANNPDNNISGISATGHSLGGAMVQEFLRDYPEGSTGVPIEGHTFGSPGSVKKGFYKFLSLGMRGAEKVFGIVVAPITSYASQAALGLAISTDSDKLYKFHTLCNFVSQKLYEKPIYKSAPAFDGRLKEFYHFADAVPKLGQSGYRRFGARFEVFNENYENPESQNVHSLRSWFSIRKHAMMGYCAILESSLLRRADILSIGTSASLEESGGLATLGALKHTINKMTLKEMATRRLNKARLTHASSDVDFLGRREPKVYG